MENPDTWYYREILRQLSGSPVGVALLSFIAPRREWSGSPTQLWEQIRPRLEKEAANTQAYSESALEDRIENPKHVNFLGVAINQHREAFKLMGVEIKRKRTGKGGRKIWLRYDASKNIIEQAKSAEKSGEKSNSETEKAQNAP